MPLKKDEQGQRWVEMELTLLATPEQVWRAMATGPGNAAWFSKAEIDGRVGGELRFDLGQGASSTGEVTAWEPPHRFAYVERDWDEGAPPLATEITITSRAGGKCVVRMVHSLFASSDAWDDQVEGFESGWPGFLQVLRAYLRYFADAPAASFLASARVRGEASDAWSRLYRALGLAAANVGERAAASSGPENWTGEVEHVHQDRLQRYLLLKVDAPAPGLALLGTSDKGGTTTVSVCRYIYCSDADALVAKAEPAWQAWLTQTFADRQSVRDGAALIERR